MTSQVLRPNIRASKKTKRKGVLVVHDARMMGTEKDSKRSRGSGQLAESQKSPILPLNSNRVGRTEFLLFMLSNGHFLHKPHMPVPFF